MFSSQSRFRIQMELDSRKNESKADLKQQDIAIEVHRLQFRLAGTHILFRRNY